MQISEVLQIAAAIIVSLGGGGSIVFGLSGYLGKIWADRGLERQKHEYSQLNIAFQNQLDMASRRIQVELDALGLIHKLRTQEEFDRLKGLWKRIANLRIYYGKLAPSGLGFYYAGNDKQKSYEEEVRRQFETWLNDTSMFLTEEMLFIPKHISEIAMKALLAAVEERFNFASFGPFLVTQTVPAAHGSDDGTTRMRMEYYKAVADSFKRFSSFTDELEILMREHIAGNGVQSKTPEASTSVKAV